LKKDILTLLDLEKEDFERLFKRSLELKARHRKSIYDRPLQGKTLGLLFEKQSTRTRLSLEAAMIQLGGVSVFISTKDTQIDRDEPIKDTARVLSRFVDGLAIRTFSHAMVEEFAEYSTIPIINALTDLYHPCQILSDILTIIEFKKRYSDLKIAWVGDGNNVAHSWINAASVLGLDLFLACPDGYMPDKKITEKARDKGCGKISITSDPFEAASEADVIYTDVWASMGQESEQAERKKVFEPFKVNSQLIKKASKDVIVMHCLPAHRGEEISEDVLEGPNSVVWDQSENKLHMHKAILEMLMGKGKTAEV
jgi:ornithine carbamoyltransferase